MAAQVISASKDGTVWRWHPDLPSGSVTNGDLWTIPAKSNHRLAVTPDGQFLILVDKTPLGSLSLRTTIGGSGPLATYVMENANSFVFSGKIVFSPTGDRMIVERLAPRALPVVWQGRSPTGDQIIAERLALGREANPRPFLDVICVDGKTEKRRFVGNSGFIRNLAFHPKRALAVTNSDPPQNGLTFWDLERCVSVRLWEDQAAAPWTPLAFSPDGTLLATNLAGKPNEPESLVLREVETGAVRHRLPAVINVMSMTFSPSGEVLGFLSSSQIFRGHLIHLANDVPILTSMPGRDIPRGIKLRFVGGSDQAMTLGDGGELALSDTGAGAKWEVLNLKHLSHFELSEDSRLLIGFCPERNRYLLYQFPEMRLIAEAPSETRAAATPRISQHPFNADNRYVVTIDALRTPQLRHGRTLELLFDFPRQQKNIINIVFSPDDLLAVLESNIDSSVTLYDIRAIRSRLAELGLDWSDDN